jgi:hypothetical protein
MIGISAMLQVIILFYPNRERTAIKPLLYRLIDSLRLRHDRSIFHMINGAFECGRHESRIAIE